MATTAARNNRCTILGFLLKPQRLLLSCKSSRPLIAARTKSSKTFPVSSSCEGCSPTVTVRHRTCSHPSTAPSHPQPCTVPRYFQQNPPRYKRQQHVPDLRTKLVSVACILPQDNNVQFTLSYHRMSPDTHIALKCHQNPTVVLLDQTKPNF